MENTTLSQEHPRLAVRVDLINRTNEYARQVGDQLTAIFRPLVGQRVLSKRLLKQIQEDLPEPPPGMVLRLNLKEDALMAEIYASREALGDTFYYDRVDIKIGPVRGRKLEEISPPLPESPVYTVAGVLAARQNFLDAEAVLKPFGWLD